MGDRRLFIEVSPQELAEFEEYLKQKKEKQQKKKAQDNTPTQEAVLDLISKIPSNKKFKETKMEDGFALNIENGSYSFNNDSIIFDYRLIIRKELKK